MSSTFPIEKFRILFPEFSEVHDHKVFVIAEQASCYFSAACGGDCSEQLWMLITAHLLFLRDKIASGQSAGAVASASIDKISVTLAQPSDRGERAMWLAASPYGGQFLALEERCHKSARAGLFFGGYPEGDAVRRVYGAQPGRRR